MWPLSHTSRELQHALQPPEFTVVVEEELRIHGNETHIAAFFAWNVSIEPTYERIAVWAPRSIFGPMHIYCEWSVRETSALGHVAETRVVTIAEMQGGRVHAMRTYYNDVAAMAAHYAEAPFPARR